MPLHPWGEGKGLCRTFELGEGERGGGPRPSGSRAGPSLSQTSCYQSPFQHSHYGASPALSDGSVPGASRGTGSQSGPASLQKGPAWSGLEGAGDLCRPPHRSRNTRERTSPSPLVRALGRDIFLPSCHRLQL